MKTVLQENGSTLIEMLLVLMLVSTMSGISMIRLSPAHQTYQEKILLNQLQEQILFCQQTAISSAQKTTCIIDNQQKRLLIRQGSNILFQHAFIKNAYFERGSLGLNEIAFNTKGNLTKSGTVFLEVNNKRYRIVFWIGRGRFDVEEV